LNVLRQGFASRNSQFRSSAKVTSTEEASYSCATPIPTDLEICKERVVKLGCSLVLVPASKPPKAPRHGFIACLQISYEINALTTNGAQSTNKRKWKKTLKISRMSLFCDIT
jgi:hypothetical protein